ncbi:MAG: hypothetical protein ACI9BD_000334, partial [Candidatus Marinamargulisbacteria bacterium]
MEIQGGGARDRSMMWPSEKRVGKTKSGEEAQQAKRNVPTSGASAAESATQVSQTGTDNNVSPTQIKPEARPLSEKDIVDQLFSLKKAPTSFNKQVLSTMIQHGLEASGENFDTILKLMRGRNKKSLLTSAVVSHSKGLSDSSKSVDILAQFLSKMPQMTQENNILQKALASYQQMLTASPDLLNPGFYAGLLGVISDLDEQLKKMR